MLWNKGHHQDLAAYLERKNASTLQSTVGIWITEFGITESFKLLVWAPFDSWRHIKKAFLKLTHILPFLNVWNRNLRQLGLTCWSAYLSSIDVTSFSIIAYWSNSDSVTLIPTTVQKIVMKTNHLKSELQKVWYSNVSKIQIVRIQIPSVVKWSILWNSLTEYQTC